jgi:hypothetical protein
MMKLLVNIWAQPTTISRVRFASGGFLAFSSSGQKGGMCFAKSSQLGPLRAFLPSESIGELPEKHHHDWLLPQKAAETMVIVKGFWYHGKWLSRAAPNGRCKIGRRIMCRNLLCPFSVVLFFGLLSDTPGLEVTAPAPADKEKQTNLDMDPHLVGWWKFDEASGKTAEDASTHGRKGTLEGGLSFDRDSVSGKIGKALRLDGGDGRVEITGYKGVIGTRPRTVAAWIKTTTSRGEILSWGSDDYGKMWVLGFIRGRIGVTPNGGYLYMNSESDDDQWHHVAAVVRQAEPPNLHDDVKLYKDGVLAEIHDIGLLDLWPIDTGGDSDVRIGRRFTGLIDDVRIYDRALADDEIKALFMLRSSCPLPKSP